jgi:hypothetical protein
MTLIMRDSVTPNAIPIAGTQIACAYDDGTFEDVAALHARFPHIPNVLIDVNGSNFRANVRDWEPGDEEGNLESWVGNHNQFTGIKDAVVYCSRDTIPSVRELTGKYVLGVDYWLWVATLDGSIITPSEQLGLIACQDKGSAQVHANYDESVVWTTAPIAWTGYVKPTPPQPPSAWSYPAPAKLTSMGGKTSFRLNWVKNFGGHPQPDHYTVWVYSGHVASEKTLVATYPRSNISGAAVTWEGGSLKTGQFYTAHLSASGVGSDHLGKNVFAQTDFVTG